MKYIIGIDIGTTATKGIIYDAAGQAAAEASESYALIQDELDQAEEDPKIIFDAVQNVIYRLASSVDGEVTAISWSSQMHSLIGLDQNQVLLTNSITWADNRAKEVVKKAKGSDFAQEIYQKTGMPIHPMAPIYKLLWLKEERPQLFKRIKYWIEIKAYIIYRLTGKIVEDITMAAGTGLLNLTTLAWDKQLLKRAGIAEENLPVIVKSIDIVGLVKKEYQQKLNLAPTTKIIAGASDGFLSTIGVGAVRDNEFALNVGTSGAVRMLKRERLLDQKARIFCYPADKNLFLLGGPVNNGGIVLAWANQVLFGADFKPNDFLALAEQVPAGSNGLIFLPYLGGERAPIWNSDARGSFIGLTRNHGKMQMARSVVEGILFNLLGAAHALSENCGKPKQIKVTGGFMQTDFIRQLAADIFNCPIAAMKNDQSGTLAAMFLARIALGLNQKIDEINQFVHEDQVYFPNQEQVAKYQQIIPVYRKLAQDLQDDYQKLADL